MPPDLKKKAFDSLGQTPTWAKIMTILWPLWSNEAAFEKSKGDYSKAHWISSHREFTSLCATFRFCRQAAAILCRSAATAAAAAILCQEAAAAILRAQSAAACTGRWWAGWTTWSSIRVSPGVRCAAGRSASCPPCATTCGPCTDSALITCTGWCPGETAPGSVRDTDTHYTACHNVPIIMINEMLQNKGVLVAKAKACDWFGLQRSTKVRGSNFAQRIVAIP